MIWKNCLSFIKRSGDRFGFTFFYWFSVSGLIKNFIDRLTSLENNGYLLDRENFRCSCER
jgi:hypothetical protein